MRADLYLLDPWGPPLTDPVPLRANIFHTVTRDGTQTAYNEGDVYTSTDQAVVSTVVGCGFADVAQSAPKTSTDHNHDVRTHKGHRASGH